jgi:hypothetical protein
MYVLGHVLVIAIALVMGRVTSIRCGDGEVDLPALVMVIAGVLFGFFAGITRPRLSKEEDP